MAFPSSCVADTSILIDLWNGGLIRPFLGTMSRVIIPDLLSLEFAAEPQQFDAMCAWGLATEALTGSELAEAAALAGSRSALSIYDCATVVLAKREAIPVATSDFGHIPPLAASLGIEILGVFPILDYLVQRAVVTPPDAADGLRQMINTGSHLPLEECRKRIARWGTRTSP